MMTTNLFLCTLMGSALSQMGEWDDTFSFSTYLDEYHQFRLYWSHLDDDVIDIGIEANSTGWIAMGLSPNGGMEHSDIMLGWVDDSDGTVTLQDRYTADSMTTPSLDDVDDLELVGGEQEDGITRLRFQRTRSLDCDDTSGHDMAVSHGTSRVIYAWNDHDGDSHDADSIAYHGATQRGTKSVNLWYGESHSQGMALELEDDADFVELTMTNWSVSTNETEYVCKVFKLPTFNDTQHVVKFQPLIEAKNEAIVHHIVGYACSTSDVYGEVDDTHQMTCDEWDTNMPSEDCRSARLQYGWAVGGGDQYFPEEAGLPMGGDTDFHYFFMEMHYDNPEHRDDIIDSSGVRMWYTPTLREYDAGLLWMGHTVNPFRQFTPQGMVTTITGYCPSDCTESGLPEEGVNAFSSLLHAHTAGAALKLRHIRDGVELQPLDVNEHYDFDYQQFIELDEMVTLLPGDQFIMECTYDTTERDGMTLAGQGSRDEMCVGFLWVYPAPTLYGCSSGLEETMVGDWLNEAYDAGYWNINTSDGKNIEDLINDGEIDSAGDLPPFYWSDAGGRWDSEKEGATAMFEKLYNDSAFSARVADCYYSRADWTETASTFEDEFGDFEEYCTGSCGCDADEERDGGEFVFSMGNVVTVVICAAVLIAFTFIMVVICGEKKKSAVSMKTHVAHSSAISGSVTGGDGDETAVA